MIALEHQEELDFLRAAQALFSGTDPRNAPLERLQFKEKGLYRDASGASPFIQALKGIVGKGVLGYLARHGGMAPNRYVLQDKIRASALFQLRPPIAIRFTQAVPDLLLKILDDATAPTPSPATLADLLAFHQVKTALLQDQESVTSPLTDFFSLQAFNSKALLVHEDVYLVLRALGKHLTQTWASHILQNVKESPPAKATQGPVLQGFTKHCVEVKRFASLTMVGRCYKVFLRERMEPEDLLRAAAAAAKKLRKVEEQEALLRAWGGIFLPAITIAQELERVVKLPDSERTTEERLMRDELLGIRDYLAQAGALSDALTKIIK